MNSCSRKTVPSLGLPRLPATLFVVASVAECLAAAACYPKAGAAPPPVSEQAAAHAAAVWPGVTPERLAAGHDLFLARCNSCHDYPDLTAIPEENVPRIVERMAHKARLNPDQQDEVLKFVLASRSQQLGQ